MGSKLKAQRETKGMRSSCFLKTMITVILYSVRGKVLADYQSQYKLGVNSRGEDFCDYCVSELYIAYLHSALAEIVSLVTAITPMQPLKSKSNWQL